MLVDNNRDFWSEVKRLRSNKTCSSNMVDDFTSLCDIANFFASKYQDLYTNVKFDKVEMGGGNIESSVLDHGFTNKCIIIFKEVSMAIDKLNSGKGDGIGSWKTDHFKNGNTELSVHVSLFLSGVIAHGNCTPPDDFQVSTVIPIPKWKNVNLSDSSNYRGIALCSIYETILTK